MDLDIALLLGIDGLATGAIYVLIALGIVLIFSVTRVIFVPFGDIAAMSALTLAMMQIGRVPGAVWIVSGLSLCALLLEAIDIARTRQLARVPRALLFYGALPLLPVVIVLLAGGMKLPMLVQMLMTLALITPICAADRAHCVSPACQRIGAGAADRGGGDALRAERARADGVRTRGLPHAAAGGRQSRRRGASPSACRRCW